jgi:hypothetical protein
MKMKIESKFSPGDKCYIVKYSNRIPFVVQATVGQVRVKVTDSPGRPGEDVFHNYMHMMVETGIGSGSVFTLGENIFETKEECEQAIKEDTNKP